MIADCDTNVVFVADTLERRFPRVYRGLASILGEHSIPLRIIPGTRDIWCRDYMPVQVAEDRFVQFRYAPDYLVGKHRHLRADGEIGPTLPWVKNCLRSEIVLDGGNVVRWTDMAIVCDKVFDENPGRKPSELLGELGRMLGVGQVIVIPTEPGDIVGHSDGVARFIKRDGVLVNDYKKTDAIYRTELRRVLKRSGLEVIELPYRPKLGRNPGIPSAFGCYLNFLQVGKVIVLPHYGLAEDSEVLGRVKQTYPGSDVRWLDCSDLSAEGGVLNCVTWTISASKWNDVETDL